MQSGAYIICATPRSGSTLLCDMLAGSGVAGNPNSYYRPPSIAHFAARMGVPYDAGTAEFDRAYLAAVLKTGRGDTDVFGLRLMWDAVGPLTERLDRLFPDLPTDALRFERAFGPVTYLYLSREDKVAQAVSRLKAEQTGLWHVAADGTERERSAPPQPAVYDAHRLSAFIAEVAHDEAAWEHWFKAQGIAPFRLTYDELVADPRPVLARVLTMLGLDPARAAGAAVRTSRMADAESLAWVERYVRNQQSAIRDQKPATTAPSR
jgi:LPS sulfotransferase NodH